MSDSPPLLDVFVLSYNRASYIGETLDSLCRQTFQDFRLVVLDNASTDDTASVVSKFNTSRPVEYICNPSNIGVLANFLQLKEISSAPWVMAFHDDDWLHPNYLEYAFAAIANHPDCQLCSANYDGAATPSADFFKPLGATPDYRLLANQRHFASFCYTLNELAFAPTIYRREALRAIDADWPAFGKMWDRPAMIEACRDGSAIVFRDIMVCYRIHPGQDSLTATSGPFLKDAIGLTRYYHTIMGSSWKTSSGRCFCVNNRAFLKGIYKWCSDQNSMAFNRFVAVARKAGAATGFSFIPRPFSRLIKKILRRIDPAFF